MYKIQETTTIMPQQLSTQSDIKTKDESFSIFENELIDVFSHILFRIIRIYIVGKNFFDIIRRLGISENPGYKVEYKSIYRQISYHELAEEPVNYVGIVFENISLELRLKRIAVNYHLNVKLRNAIANTPILTEVLHGATFSNAFCTYII